MQGYTPHTKHYIMCLPAQPSSSSVFVVHSLCACVCLHSLFLGLCICYSFEKHNESKHVPACPSSSSVFVVHRVIVLTLCFCLFALSFLCLCICYSFKNTMRVKMQEYTLCICTILQVLISSKDDLSSDVCGPPSFVEISIQSPGHHFKQSL